ncbi:related to acetyl-CoA transporter [Hanseniaspora guilliermondii]|uniref:Related to acetyl-CoA transporter n=1 Tax=Hanseniaspora guilliermondii TaxID=56406 RepID=A0A1L0AWI5_9ASCO|nr:related to acetyl-CoA transporter [Hanseniaspora guilliermondii]
MKTLSKKDKPQFLLLVCLYFLQGLPCGLTYGSVPFILKTLTTSNDPNSNSKALSLTQIGIFSMATYPYSFKILWSPIIDSFYFKNIGRRRTWIIPLQFLISFIFLFLSMSKTIIGLESGEVENIDLTSLTFCFLTLIFSCATQDIAVDGWALEILSEESLSFASTAQTLGLNIGYFTSFTLFLNLRSGKLFNHKISIMQYFRWCSIVYLLITLYIVFFTREDMNPDSGFKEDLEKDEQRKTLLMLKNETDKVMEADFVKSAKVENNDHSLKTVFQNFKHIIKLSNVQTLVLIHLVSKFPFQCNDSATQLRLLDKGFKSEDLAISVLINFPLEMFFGYYVGKWSSQTANKDNSMVTKRFKNPFLKFMLGEQGCLTAWLLGYLGRLLFGSILGNLIVYLYPKSKTTLPMWYFLMVIVHNLSSSLMNTVQFVSICSFHTQIADPKIGGTYITLLNTFSNLGGTWPKILVLRMIDYYTVKIVSNGKEFIEKDGYYKVNIISIIIGILLYFKFLKKNINKLQKLPKSVWRKD